MATFEHGVGSALDEDLVGRRHRRSPSPGIEREPGDHLVERHAVDGDELLRERVDRCLHGVARGNPPPVLVPHGPPPGTGARRRCDLGRRSLELSVRRPDLAAGLVAAPAPLQGARRRPDLHDPHPVLGERSRLVGTDERRRSECLHRFEASYQRMLVGHPLGSDRQRQCHGGQETLGNEGHGDADGEHERVRWRRVEEQGQQEESATGRDSDERNRAHETMQLACQGRVGADGVLCEHGDSGELGRGAGRSHDRPPLALDDERAGAETIAGADRVGNALAGHGRGVDEQSVALDAGHVGCHAIAVGEDDQVVGHEAVGVDQERRSVTHDHHLERKQALQPGRRLLGSVLLGEGEQRVDHDHDEDRDPQLRKSTDDREHAGHPEHGGEEVGEFCEQLTPDGCPRRRGECVRTDIVQPSGSVGRGEPGQGCGVGHSSNVSLIDWFDKGIRSLPGIRDVTGWRRGDRRRCRVPGTGGTRRSRCRERGRGTRGRQR